MRGTKKVKKYSFRIPVFFAESDRFSFTTNRFRRSVWSIFFEGWFVELDFKSPLSSQTFPFARLSDFLFSFSDLAVPTSANKLIVSGPVGGARKCVHVSPISFMCFYRKKWPKFLANPAPQSERSWICNWRVWFCHICGYEILHCFGMNIKQNFRI